MQKVFLIISLIVSCSLFAQNINITNISNLSAKINFNNPFSQEVRLHVFTKSSEDTIIFKEEFSKLPKVGSAQYIGGLNIPLNIPASYTLQSGCQAQNIYSTYGDSCYLRQTNSKEEASFVTPLIDLSKSNGEFNIIFKLKNTSAKINKLYILLSDENGYFVNKPIDSISSNANNTSIINYYKAFSNGKSKTKVKFQIKESSNASSLIIDDILITYPSITRNEVYNSPIITTSNEVNINTLTPNTKYYCFIEGYNDTVSFVSEQRFVINQVEIEGNNSANVILSHNETMTKPILVLRKRSNPQTVFAKDLFISEYSSVHPSKAVEIYNGTGKDICLKDYSLKLYSTSVQSFTFNEQDTIRNNQCIVVAEFTDNLILENNGIFFKKMLPTFTNAYSIALLKNDTYVDIMGKASPNPASGLSTNLILRRKSSISKGVSINPTSGFPTLSSEWTQIGTTATSINFNDFGRHTMDNAFGNIDSLAFVKEINFDESSINISNLEQGAYYDAYLMIVNQTDTTFSNVKSFRMPLTTQRTAQGNWNDDNWSNGIPTIYDNVVVPHSLKVTIPQGYIAKCGTLILRDDIEGKRAEIVNNGTLEIGNKVFVEVDLKGYGEGENQWNLMGLPIDISNISHDTIQMKFFHISSNDDLYSWQENYTDKDNMGRWINSKSIPNELKPFFQQVKGYLLAYKEDTKLIFEGRLNDDSSYILVNNTSVSEPKNDRGWHLSYNPYPFSITLSNLQSNNNSYPSILDPLTLNYIPVSPLSYQTTILPYQGFWIQADNSINSLIVKKQASQTKKEKSNYPILTIKVSDNANIGDMTRVVFMSSASNDYNYKYDNRKIHGLGDAPQIYTKINSQEYAIKTINKSEDSIIFDLEINSKKEGNYSISVEREGFDAKKIILWDKSANNPLVDYKQSDEYKIYMQANQIKAFQIRCYNNKSSLQDINDRDEIKLSQSGSKISVINPKNLKTLEIRDINGNLLGQSNTNTIVVNQKGVFILSITTTDNVYQKKIINL